MLPVHQVRPTAILSKKFYLDLHRAAEENSKAEGSSDNRRIPGKESPGGSLSGGGRGGGRERKNNEVESRTTRRGFG